jgi:hypothetical protein
VGGEDVWDWLSLATHWSEADEVERAWWGVARVPWAPELGHLVPDGARVGGDGGADRGAGTRVRPGPRRVSAALAAGEGWMSSALLGAPLQRRQQGWVVLKRIWNQAVAWAR